MAENYTVNYRINVDERPAVEAITRFQQATEKMVALTRTFDMVAKSVGRINSALASISKKPVTINISTEQAERRLSRIEAQLRNIRTLSATALNGGVQAARATRNTNPWSAANNSRSVQAFIKQLNSAQRNITNLNNHEIRPRANVTRAINSLDLLINKIKQVKAQGNIVITASAAGASGAAGRGGRGTTVVPTRTGTTRIPANPTIRQTLGPTYAASGPSFVGEMVKGMGIAYGLSSLISGVTGVFRDATHYDNISQTTRNILSAHDNRMGFDARFQDMNNVMRQIGIETRFTAPQVAGAGKYLAMAGYRIEDIQETMPHVANMALIADSGLEETADVVTNIMTGYEMSAKKMGIAADILTQTSTMTNSTLMELAESFKYAGPWAHSAGVQFEELTAALGILHNAGRKGSLAGTDMRMIISNIINPNKKQAAAWAETGVKTRDSNGNLRNLTDIFADLNKLGEQMGPTQFASLMGRMFRVTAVPGAMALASQSGRFAEIVEQNQMSNGLSERLADAKKNTIQGLWFQMTSAFTESGMQGFESMQSAIRDFLQKMIQLMKSPEFATALRDAMDMFMRMVDVLVSVFKSFMQIWNAIPQWGKDGLVWFFKIQMTFGIIASIGKSIYSTWMGVKYLLVGSWLSNIVTMFVGIAAPVGRTLQYMVQMYALSRQMAGLGVMQSAANAVKWGLFSQAGAAGLITGSGAAVANTVGGAAGAGMAGGGVTLLGMIGKLGGFLLTNHVGWAISAAVAIGAIGYAVYDTYQITEQARLANVAWGESYKNLGLDKINFADTDALLAGNLKIFNDQLFTQNEQVEKSIDLWVRYWEAKNGPKKEQTADETAFAETDAGKLFKADLEAADAWFNVDSAFRPLLDSLGGQLYSQYYISQYGTHKQDILKLFNATWNLPYDHGTDIDERVAVQLALAKLGADPTNKDIINMRKYLTTNAPSVRSYQEFQNIMDSATKTYRFTSHDSQYDWISNEKADDLSEAQIHKTKAYTHAFNSQVDAMLAEFALLGEVFKAYDNGDNITPETLQKVLAKYTNGVGAFFDTAHGLLGSDTWNKWVGDMLNNPQKYGYQTAAQVTDGINQTFDALLAWYSTLDSHYKPLFAGYLNRNLWMGGISPGKSLNEGGYQGGTKEGDTAVFNGKKYTWKTVEPYVIPQWVADDGSIYTPTDAKTTQTWTPTTPTTNPLHTGTDQSEYKSHYNNQSAAPKQVIVKIENLMRVDKQTIDMTDDRQVAAIENIKTQLATALLDVVQDFNANIV